MAQELITIQGGAGEVTTAAKDYWAVVEEWLEAIVSEKHRKPRTVDGYRYNIGVFKQWLDSEGIEHATRQDVKNWCKAMEAKGWKPATCNAYLATVRTFYKWLADEHGIENIAAGISNWKESKEHKRGFLSIKEMKKLLAVVDVVTKNRIAEAEKKNQTKFYRTRIVLEGKRDKAILATLMCGALRTIEVSSLRIADFTHDGGACVLNVLGKGRTERETVKISPKVEAVIRDWLNAREAADVVSDTSPLFCSLGNNSFGEPITSLSVSRLCKEYLQAAELKEKKYTRGGSTESKPVTAHSLRGSCATNAFLKGASLTAVQQQLRHRNLSTTNIYLEEAEKFKNPVSDLIADDIF